MADGGSPAARDPVRCFRSAGKEFHRGKGGTADGTGNACTQPGPASRFLWQPTMTISRSLSRRLEHLEYRSELVGEPAGEPTIINLNFVDKDSKVVNQMQMTIAVPPNDSGWRARAWRRSYR
jgi:hypothetical protein